MIIDVIWRAYVERETLAHSLNIVCRKLKNFNVINDVQIETQK
jgi:hypothetical protein